MTTNSKLLDELRTLEIELHRPEIRSNAERLNVLLHDSFIEFGRSGRRFNKAGILKQLALEDATGASGSIWSQDFLLEEVAEGVVLLLYKSAQRHETGELTRHTNRASLWERTTAGWQMRFHQGTATEAFVPEVP